MPPYQSITIILSPYHVGIRDHRVGNGPLRIRARGIKEELLALGLAVQEQWLEPVDTFEGEIGRTFANLAATSSAVSKAIAASSFPLILSGNCINTIGVACGIGPDNVNYIYFDAHDDMHTPSTLEHGYFDAMGLPILLGESFHAAARAIPGFRKLESYKDRFLYVGLRDCTEGERARVVEHEMDAIWGSSSSHVDFPKELTTRLQGGLRRPAVVHLDLDVLDKSVGKVNGYESSGGLSEEELVDCLACVAHHAEPASLTICSFDPNLGDGDKIAAIAVRATVAFVTSMLQRGTLKTV